MKSLAHYWYRPGLLAALFTWPLLPLSWLYCVIAVGRRKAYQLRFNKSYAAGVPLIVIGNIVAGGSGKTPLLIALCELIKEKGFKPGVVSRGYGGAVNGIKQVQKSDSAELVGDEPLMIYQRTGIPLVVGADRVAAVNYLLQNNQCDVVLSDDGLQHYRMRRDIEVAVVDASRGFGNGFCLPAGPLRERVSRLNDVDLIVYNGANDNAESCCYTLEIVDVCALDGERHTPLSSFAGKRVHAVAGIGHPSRFFAQLRDNEIDVIEHAFSDHHVFSEADFSGWQNDCILMTEKDAVKCRQLLLSDAWAVNVSAVFSGALQSQIDSKILPLLKQAAGE
jgi:tetraacyldisaccharide 4'-kinase